MNTEINCEFKYFKFLLIYQKPNNILKKAAIRVMLLDLMCVVYINDCKSFIYTNILFT
jgi:hypothetical protein